MRRLAILAAGAAAVGLAWLAPAEREGDIALPSPAKTSSSAAPASRLAALPERDALGAARDGCDLQRAQAAKQRQHRQMSCEEIQ